MDRADLIKTQLQAMEWYYEGYGRGDIELAYRGFAEDAEWTGVGADLFPKVYRGKKAMIEYQNAWVHEVFTDGVVYTPRHTLCDGNVLFSHWTDEATYRETGEKYENYGTFVFEFDLQPLVQRAWSWFDTTPLRGGPERIFAGANLDD